jgi:sugar lactone lactonase YvrE
MGLTVDRDGNLYWVDSGNYRIRKATPAGVTSLVSGVGTWGATDGAAGVAQFDAPEGIALSPDERYLYIADTGNARIRKVAVADGATTTLAGSTYGYAEGQGTAARFAALSTVTTDQLGNIYVGDNANYRIRKVTPEGLVSTLAGTTSGSFLAGAASTSRIGPWGVYVAPDGYLYSTSHHYVIRVAQP